MPVLRQTTAIHATTKKHLCYLIPTIFASVLRTTIDDGSRFELLCLLIAENLDLDAARPIMCSEEFAILVAA